METWKCHICGEIKPDNKIAVLSAPLIIDGQVVGEQNIRYCDDNTECIVKAQTFRHI